MAQAAYTESRGDGSQDHYIEGCSEQDIGALIEQQTVKRKTRHLMLISSRIIAVSIVDLSDKMTYTILILLPVY